MDSLYTFWDGFATGMSLCFLVAAVAGIFYAIGDVDGKARQRGKR
jgi:hypothetical protein|tara:strand:+ start:151 stop:285 length:135 start_codon:yes stop_codon:yes gene_type:complete